MIFGSAFTGVSTLESYLEEILEDMGIARRAGLRIPSALLSPRIVAETDMIATLPDRFVERFRSELSLSVLELPFAVPELPVSMVWHERTHRNAAMVWLRERIRAVAKAEG